MIGEPVKYRDAFTDAYDLLKDEKGRGKMLRLMLSLGESLLKQRPKPTKLREERHAL